MRYLITCMLVIITSIAFSQATSLDSAEARKAVIEFNGGKYNGYLIELNADPDIVETTIKERFKLEGVKPKETKGFMVFRNVVIKNIDPVKPVDAFIKVERKSKKEKDQAVVYLIAANPGEIGEDKVKSDAAAKTMGLATFENGPAFLTGIIPQVKQGVHDNKMMDQQALLKKEEKKLKGLIDDQTDLEKKLKKLQSDIEYNKKAVERQTAEVEKEKKALDELNLKNPSKAGQK